ncbi:HipA domain-containing protein [Nocardioides sp.]|uniref:HipA domain-containing protein n=1 Tax=Nocardioides sp. TaxID=35761 RepID=UPI0026117236|nr:HipA domain-containing protein [Nocardioides sp.]
MIEARNSAGNDYLDLAAAIEDTSASPAADLRQLWLRIAFTVAVNNTDDHFVNHGFLRQGAGWILSPAFDVNPTPSLARPRVSALAGAVRRDDTLEKLHTQAEYFGLSAAEARSELTALATSLTGWRALAAEDGIAPAEQEHVGAVIDSFVAAYA